MTPASIAAPATRLLVFVGAVCTYRSAFRLAFVFLIVTTKPNTLALSLNLAFASPMTPMCVKNYKPKKK